MIVLGVAGTQRLADDQVFISGLSRGFLDHRLIFQRSSNDYISNGIVIFYFWLGAPEDGDSESQKRKLEEKYAEVDGRKKFWKRSEGRVDALNAER